MENRISATQERGLRSVEIENEEAERIGRETVSTVESSRKTK